MKAIGFLNSLPIDHADSLIEFDLPDPELRPNDLLVAVEAISVNPADAKRRIRTAPDEALEAPMILGYDAVGTVEAVGPDVIGFKKGDRVWYAGDAGREGSNAELQAVDHSIVSLAPTSISPTAAASLPLVTLTAWEVLFDRLQIPQDETRASVLVIGGAGGVGSITLQLLRKLTGHEAIATASRDDSADWCRKMGAHEIVDHRDLVASTRANGREFVDYIAHYNGLDLHWDAMCDLIAPQGRISSIAETPEKLDLCALQGKSVGFMWELMFTRSMFGTQDMARQGAILSRMARMVDDGIISSTETKSLHGLSAETLKNAHRIIETGAMIGKLTVTF